MLVPIAQGASEHAQLTSSGLERTRLASQSLPYYDSGARREPIRDEIRELWRYRNLIVHMVKRNITSRYKRSLLGILWTLLDPLLTMLVMAVVYGALFRVDVKAFPVFLLAGLMVWNFISQASTDAMTGLMYSGSLVGQVYMPKSVFTVAAIGTGLVNFIFSLAPLFLFVVAFARPITPALLFVPVALVIISMFTLGIGLIMSALAIFFADMVSIYNFIMRLGLFVSGIFYYVDQLPQNLQLIVRLNPAYHMVRIFRDPVYEGILPRWEIAAYATAWGLFMFILGFWVFDRFSDEYAYHI